MNKNKLGIGLLLISIGLIWLIGVITDIRLPLLSSFFRLWPLLFIAIGFSIIFSKKKTIQTIVWIIYFLIIVIYSVITSGVLGNEPSGGLRGTGNRYTHTESYIEGNDRAMLSIESGGSEINLIPVSDELFRADIFDEQIVFDISDDDITDISVYSRRRSRTITDMSLDYTWDIELGTGVIWDVNLEMGAVKAMLDFRGIGLRELDISTGASKLEVYFPDEEIDSDIHIRAGASDIDLYFSQNTGVRIRQQGALASNNYSSAGFEKSGDYYFSKNYEQSSNKLDLAVEIGVGAIKVGFYD